MFRRKAREENGVLQWEKEVTRETCEAFKAEIYAVMKRMITDLLQIADKRRIDRDSIMEYFSKLFSAVVSVGTFRYYKGKDEKEEKEEKGE